MTIHIYIYILSRVAQNISFVKLSNSTAGDFHIRRLPRQVDHPSTEPDTDLWNLLDIWGWGPRSHEIQTRNHTTCQQISNGHVAVTLIAKPVVEAIAIWRASWPIARSWFEHVYIEHSQWHNLRIPFNSKGHGWERIAANRYDHHTARLHVKHFSHSQPLPFLRHRWDWQGGGQCMRKH